MRSLAALVLLGGLVGCSGGGSGSSSTGPMPSPTPTNGSLPSPTPSPASAPTMDPNLTLASSFHGDAIAKVPGARELAPLPNGDLLVGTETSTVYLVPSAESSGAAGAPQAFIVMSEGLTNGVALGSGYVYIGTEHNVWRVPYHSGDRSEPSSSAVAIAAIRQGSPPPGSDGDVHRTTSLAVSGTTLYAGIGSSCNACTEIDPTRATIQRMGLDGSGMTTLATRFRNAIALAINPATGALWAGGAGQDGLPYGHPYEFFDPVTLHAEPADYGWPVCEENHNPFGSGAGCAATIAPRVEFPAYATEIGAAFYPSAASGTYAFPASYRGGAFVAMHGSWHCCPSTVPRVAFVPMSGDAPATPVNWSDPTVQWQPFLFDTRDSSSSTSYPVRFTGVAVGPQGSLFVADDASGTIYRIRPSSSAAASAVRRSVR